MGKKRASISDKLEALAHQDERTAAGLVLIVAALADRHPQDINLAMAKRSLADFCTSLAPGATPAPPEEPRG